jgi:hypothetical protein
MAALEVREAPAAAAARLCLGIDLGAQSVRCGFSAGGGAVAGQVVVGGVGAVRLDPDSTGPGPWPRRAQFVAATAELLRQCVASARERVGQGKLSSCFLACGCDDAPYRLAVLEAAREALGPDVEVGFVSTPLAAALGLAPLPQAAGTRLLVVDCGASLTTCGLVQLPAAPGERTRCIVSRVSPHVSAQLLEAALRGDGALRAPSHAAALPSPALPLVTSAKDDLEAVLLRPDEPACLRAAPCLRALVQLVAAVLHEGLPSAWVVLGGGARLPLVEQAVQASLGEAGAGHVPRLQHRVSAEPDMSVAIGALRQARAADADDDPSTALRGQDANQGALLVGALYAGDSSNEDSIDRVPAAVVVPELAPLPATANTALPLLIEMCRPLTTVVLFEESLVSGGGGSVIPSGSTSTKGSGIAAPARRRRIIASVDVVIGVAAVALSGRAVADVSVAKFAPSSPAGITLSVALPGQAPAICSDAQFQAQRARQREQRAAAVASGQGRGLRKMVSEGGGPGGEAPHAVSPSSPPAAPLPAVPESSAPPPLVPPSRAGLLSTTALEMRRHSELSYSSMGSGAGSGADSGASRSSPGGDDDDVVAIVSTVVLNLVGARDLARADTFGQSDPFCVASLNGQRAGHTCVDKRTLSPSWDQRIYLPVPRHLLRPEDELSLDVYDHDRILSDDFLGRAVLSGAELVALTKDGREGDVMWCPLGMRSDLPAKKQRLVQGQVGVRLSRHEFSMTVGMLEFIRAQRLQAPRPQAPLEQQQEHKQLASQHEPAVGAFGSLPGFFRALATSPAALLSSSPLLSSPLYAAPSSPTESAGSSAADCAVGGAGGSAGAGAGAGGAIGAGGVASPRRTEHHHKHRRATALPRSPQRAGAGSAGSAAGSESERTRASTSPAAGARRGRRASTGASLGDGDGSDSSSGSDGDESTDTDEHQQGCDHLMVRWRVISGNVPLYTAGALDSLPRIDKKGHVKR